MILIADVSAAEGTLGPEAGNERLPPPSHRGPTNREVAEVLERIADLLEARDANPFRVGAYLRAARRVRGLPRPVVSLLSERGVRGLERLPDIGRSIAALIRELVETGRVRLLERLEGSASPEEAFVQVPGIGEVLAERVHRELGIETLEELELAAHDGRLAQVEGFGERKVQGVRDALAGMLGRPRRRRAGRRLRPPPVRGETVRKAAGAEESPAASSPVYETSLVEPTVGEILSVDAEYRRRAEAGELRRIAPRRFNPAGEAWLPILHTQRGKWRFTALYSNTAQAHRLGRTRDWVVVYWKRRAGEGRGAEDREGDEGQATVVTEYQGVLEGLRVVRGREEASLEHYRREGHVWAEEDAAAEKQGSLALG